MTLHVVDIDSIKGSKGGGLSTHSISIFGTDTAYNIWDKGLSRRQRWREGIQIPLLHGS